jgi:hypothetical protein
MSIIKAFTCKEQEQMKVNVEEGTEFFIASCSCSPGGIRHHENICINDFSKAIKFVKLEDCYPVFCYGFDMYIWHYKIVKGEAILVKEINLNDYVIGALDDKKEFVSTKDMIKIFNDGCWTASEKGINKYKGVIYSDIPEIKICNSLKEEDIIKVRVLESTNKEGKIVTAPSEKESIFMLNYGYRWEDTDDLFAFTY